MVRNHSSQTAIGLRTPVSPEVTRRRLQRITLDAGEFRITAAIGVRRRVVADRAERTALKVWALRIAAVFALIWSIFRAARQSITVDEADTYFWFAGGRPAGFLWEGFPNNHVLNTLGIWLTTHCFGVSALTLRIPALLGAALYISVAYFLSRALTDRFALQLGTFLCLVYNPFLLDFFAAARGYSLANAFLLAALAVPLWQARGARRSVAASAALASAAIGLSFCANLSFAFVDIAALLAVAIWAIRQRGPSSVPRIAACCALPALAISLAICGYSLTHYDRSALWYGAHSLGEMARSLRDATLYRLCEPLARFAGIRAIGPMLLLSLAVLGVWRLLAGCVDHTFRRSMRGRMTAAIIGILMAAIAAHYLAFRAGGLPLPLSRTAIYFLPLCTLLLATIAAAPAASRVSRRAGQLLAAGLLCLAAHYLLCLRYTYFKEYDQDAEVKEVYRVVEQLNQRYGVREFTSDGAYTSPLNFYRAIAKVKNFPELPGYPGMVPPGKAVYILHGSYHRDFIDEHKLAVVYRGRISQVVVALPRLP